MQGNATETASKFLEKYNFLFASKTFSIGVKQLRLMPVPEFRLIF
jgi:hypothetical protein